MPCLYLRHINLHAVYEQLPKYEPGNVSPALANIPPQLCETLAPYFEELAEIAADNLEGFPDWRRWAPIEIAAEVGDLIESELERIECGATSPAPLADAVLSPGESLESFLCFAAEATEDAGADYLTLACLLVYQYNALCSLYTRGHMAGVLAVFESIAETRESLTHCLGLEARKWALSHEARQRAAQRHAPTNQQKVAALAAWEEHGGNVSSMAAFARARWKDFGVTERTLYAWIRDHRRATT